MKNSERKIKRKKQLEEKDLVKNIVNLLGKGWYIPTKTVESFNGNYNENESDRDAYLFDPDNRSA